ncbi:MAG: serine hydrolase [Burkholderiales bacterium]|nr:serine hydrolase [Burkholderiales bacterium]
MLLAALIEVITAEPLERYIEREVMAPLDLGDTGLAARDSDVAQLSAGHDAKGRRDDAAYRDDGIAPIGGLYATVDDLVVRARAQTDPSARSAACIAAPSGWAQGERFGRRAMWHAGLTNSHAGFVPRFRDEDSLIVALGNRGGKSAVLGRW